MSEDERAFLISEYEASWETIQNIDERRGTFLSYYAILFAAALSVISAIIAAQGFHNRETRVFLILILVGAIVAGIAIVGLLVSERKANVKYRERVNTIRELLLASSVDPQVRRYLAGEQHNPKGMGRTLWWIFGMIGTQVAVAVGIAAYLALS